MLQSTKRYPGFAFLIDTKRNPFLVPQALEAMDLLDGTSLGKKLFSLIAAAKPKARADFPKDANVIVTATHERIQFIQKGYNLDVTYGMDHQRIILGLKPSKKDVHNIESRCEFHINGTSVNDSVDKMAAGDGSGSVCYMRYSNAQIMTSKEEAALPHIVLAHELIHSLHCLNGERKNDGEEEWTTGIGKYKDEPMSENAFREELKLPLRKSY